MLDYDAIRALLAVEREGSFEGAGRSLSVSSSAISQRIKSLEIATGAVMIKRGKPACVTEIGNTLCRHIEMVLGMESELKKKNSLTFADERETSPIVRISINEDCLSGWFIDVISRQMEKTPDWLFDISTKYQDYSGSDIKSGDTLVAISDKKSIMSGFTSIPLGTLSYRATASPAFMEKYFPNGVTLDELAEAPSLRYSAFYDLQHKWICENFGKDIKTRNHMIPNSHLFVSGCLKNIGWGLNTAAMSDEYIASGELVELIPGKTLDIKLYWHYCKAIAESVRPLTESVVEVARQHLIQDKPEKFKLPNK